MAKKEEKKEAMTEQKKESVLQKLWLTYYNDTLYAKDLITETQRNKMRVMIKNRAASMER